MMELKIGKERAERAYTRGSIRGGAKKPGGEPAVDPKDESRRGRNGVEIAGVVRMGHKIGKGEESI